MEQKKMIDWSKRLLMFEHLAGQPLIISLLVEKGDISFLSCTIKKLDNDFDDETEQPDIELSKIMKDLKGSSLVSKSNYIG